MHGGSLLRRLRDADADADMDGAAGNGRASGFAAAMGAAAARDVRPTSFQIVRMPGSDGDAFAAPAAAPLDAAQLKRARGRSLSRKDEGRHKAMQAPNRGKSSGTARPLVCAMSPLCGGVRACDCDCDCDYDYDCERFGAVLVVAAGQRDAHHELSSLLQEVKMLSVRAAPSGSPVPRPSIDAAQKLLDELSDSGFGMHAHTNARGARRSLSPARDVGVSISAAAVGFAASVDVGGRGGSQSPPPVPTATAAVFQPRETYAAVPSFTRGAHDTPYNDSGGVFVAPPPVSPPPQQPPLSLSLSQPFGTTATTATAAGAARKAPSYSKSIRSLEELQRSQSDAAALTVRSTATGYGAGDVVPRRALPLGVSSPDDVMRHHDAPPARARPVSAPRLEVNAEVTLPTDVMPPAEVLHRLFTHHGVRVPYQYFYKHKSFIVVPRMDLFPWKDMVDDALLRILSRCTGHTTATTYLRLDYCTRVTDAGVCALLPRLSKLRQLDMRVLGGITDKAIVSVTTPVPVAPAHADGARRGARGSDATALVPSSTAVAATPHATPVLLGEAKTVAAHASRHVSVASSGPHGSLLHHAESRTVTETVHRVYHVDAQSGAGAGAATGGGGGAAAGRGGGPPRLTDATKLALPCPRLVDIDVCGCYGVTDRSLLALSSSLTSVTSLKLNGTRIGDAGLRELLVHCRALKTLHVADTLVSDAALDQLLIMARLVPINPLVQRKDVLASRANPAAFASLAASGRPRVAPSNAEYYLVLEDLNISGCSRLSAKGLEILMLVRACAWCCACLGVPFHVPRPF